MKILTIVLLSFACLFGASAVAFAESGTGELVQRIYGPYAPVVLALAGSLVRFGAIALFAFPAQALWPAIRRKPKVLTYEFWLDLIYWSQGTWLSLLSFYVAVQWIATLIYRDNEPWWPAIAGLPLWLQVLLAVWLFDFAAYWRHRWEHKFSALWSYHAVHHTAEKVDVLTTFRLHPFELALGALFNAAVTKLGLHPVASGLGFAIYLHYNFFIHTNVRIKFPGFLKYLLVSPFMHQWHHANDAEAAGRNLGVVFAWNDWLFKTAHHPERWPSDFGLAAPSGERVGQSYLRQLLYPLQFLLARVGAWRGARADHGSVGS